MGIGTPWATALCLRQQATVSRKAFALVVAIFMNLHVLGQKEIRFA